MSKTLQMKDVLWDHKVARTATRDGRCAVCHKPYAACISFRIATHPRGRFVKFVNLPCGHTDPLQSYANFGGEVASDVLARLLLVAEDM